MTSVVTEKENNRCNVRGWSTLRKEERVFDERVGDGSTIKNYHYEFNSTDRVLAKIVEDVFKGIMNIKADRKTEPTCSKMEQVEDEPQTERSE